ncbi:tail fiber protein [Tenacibaculum tangerinum]|uniref:Tail fiber protein n=1 Tax=Tenacibaculum tangerinum TaxID=3038772 RepID=A0ABY8L2C1_9FLAO|nr:tail fiber protein [Tenacibaculum tangerinum]WGH75409.1 tail fiber protein [Tenacibaculum tangerinum]
MDPFVGQITLFGGNFAPRGWAFCDGQLLAISQNTALFSILGTTYGGDGRTTFALPDLRGRAPIGPRRGPGLSLYRLGQRGGQETHILNINEMPSHNHSVQASSSHLTLSTDNAVNETPAAGDVPAVSNYPSGITSQKVKSFGPPNNTVNGQSIPSNTNVLNNGGNLAHNNMQPYLAVNYIIALFGVFPSRD